MKIPSARPAQLLPGLRWPPGMAKVKEPRAIRVPHYAGGHFGGDVLMKDKLFKDPGMPDPLEQPAGTRDGIMSVLIGVAARSSADSGKPVRIAELASLKPMAKRPRG